MEFSEEYQVALELASALRYEEAGQKLKSILSEHPDKMEALILLGKVEYYLRLFPSSRRRFETVLTHDPGNLEAYYGLQFFVERKRRIWTVIAWLTSLLLFLVVGVILNNSISNVFHRFEEQFEKQIEYNLEAEAELFNKIIIMSENLDRYSNDLAVFKEGTEVWKEDFSKRVGDLDLIQLEQYSKLQNIQSDYYRTIIKELKEISARLEDGTFAAESLSSVESSIQSDN